MGFRATRAASILVVEDEASLLKLVTKVLVRDGHDVVGAPDGESGRDVFVEHRDALDLVFLDVNIPPRGIVGLLEQILAARPDIAVILSSGEDLSTELQALLDRCRGAFLRKPFKPKDMLRLVRELCRLDGPAREASPPGPGAA